MADKNLWPTFYSGKNKVWGGSSLRAVNKIFKKLDLKKYNSFLDVGSGDGRVTLLASFFTNAEGVEASRYLIEIGKRIRNKLDLNAEFHCIDYSEINFSNYDVLYIYRDKRDETLIKKIKKEFKGLIIMYKLYPFGDCEKIVIDGIPFFILKKDK